jgi:acyl transferase domain-containing protein
VIDFGTTMSCSTSWARRARPPAFDNPAAWKALQAQGIFRGSGAKPGKIAFLFPGQGSQYINMGGAGRSVSRSVAQVFKDADVVMTPILGKPLTSYIFADAADPEAMKRAELTLMQTAITQPAMLTMDTALYKLLAEYGFAPDMVMGHSLGEYAALIAAGIMPFAHALEASAARGAEMTKVSMDDNGWMAAVMAPLEVVEATLKEVDGYAVAANINSYNQAWSAAPARPSSRPSASSRRRASGACASPSATPSTPRSWRRPASRCARCSTGCASAPKLPLVANVTGDIYPTTVEGIKDILELQIASPVQWVKGLETMYREGVRTFVEVGPKRALKGFRRRCAGHKPDVWSLLTNHPKNGELESFNQALCGLYAAGYGVEGRGARGAGRVESVVPVVAASTSQTQEVKESATMPQPVTPMPTCAGAGSAPGAGSRTTSQAAQRPSQLAPRPSLRPQRRTGRLHRHHRHGAGLARRQQVVMDPDNAMRILRGEQFVDLIPERFRREMATRRITRLVKSEDGSGSFEVIDNSDDVIKLAGRGGSSTWKPNTACRAS